MPIKWSRNKQEMPKKIIVEEEEVCEAHDAQRDYIAKVVQKGSQRALVCCLGKEKHWEDAWMQRLNTTTEWALSQEHK